MTGAGPAGGVDVSRETMERLLAYQALALRWNARINLFSSASAAGFWDRHIVDSLQIYPLAPAGARIWADLGSGGGLPGIPLACILAERNPAARLTLIESDQRKVSFLRTVIRELQLPATVLMARIDAAPPQMADVLTARALAALDDLMPMAMRHLSPGGVALFSKGRAVADEIALARQHWQFDLAQTVSKTDPEARLLRIERIAPV